MGSDPTDRSGVPSDGDDDFDDGIDWEDLQDFFLTDLKPRLAEADRLYRKAELSGLHRFGHSLKGSGGGVKLPRFSEIGSDIESAAQRGDLKGLLPGLRALRDEFIKHRPEEAPAVRLLFEDADTSNGHELDKASGF